MKIINSQLMESTKVSFGYNSNLGVYTTLMSDILKLYAIRSWPTFRLDEDAKI